MILSLHYLCETWAWRRLHACVCFCVWGPVCVHAAPQASCLTNSSQAELITHRCCTRQAFAFMCDVEELCVHAVKSNTEHEMKSCDKCTNPTEALSDFCRKSSTPNQVCTFSSVKPHYGTFHISICWTSSEKQRVDIFYLITRHFFCSGPVGRAENHITRSWANNSLTFLLSAVRHKFNFVIRQRCLLISIFPRGGKSGGAGWNNAALISRSASIKAAERLTGACLLWKRLFSLF